MTSALSPVKTKRMDEKASLQTLNSRLEQYVLRVKEMEDAKNVAERELDTIRKRMQHDIDSIQARLSKELEETRKQLDIELDHKSRLQLLEQDQNKELIKLRTQVKELSELKGLVESLTSELTKEKTNSQSLKAELSTNTTELQHTRRQLKDMDRELRAVQALYNDSMKENQHLREKTNTFDLTRDTEITTLRKEMNLKNQESLIQWKKETKERLETVEKEVRHYFENVVDGLKNQVNDLTMELESTKKELDKTSIEYEQSLQNRQQLTDKVLQLEKEYREERNRFKEDRKTSEIMIEKLRQWKINKENEFNDLMDIKIALDTEIETYRCILDREEGRVGLPTPPTKNPEKKRKKSSIFQQKSNKKQKKELPTLDISISQLDLEKDRIVIENHSTTAISMGGWEVRGRLENQVFRFPMTYTIPPQSRMSVWSNKRNKNANEEREPNEDSFLATKFSLNPNGDFIVLMTKEGVPVSTKGEGLSSEEVKELEKQVFTELEDEVPTGEGCGIM